MPSKDPEIKRATARRSYARNREKVIAAVAHRKKTAYAGVCRNCGGPTMGESKNQIREWCHKPECRSAQYKADPRFVDFGMLGKQVQETTKSWATPNGKRKKDADLDEILEEMEKRKRRRKVG